MSLGTCGEPDTSVLLIPFDSLNPKHQVYFWEGDEGLEWLGALPRL